MARTKPSAAHRALIDAAQEHGATVSSTKLERWRQQAWLPAPAHWFESAGSTVIKPQVLNRTLWLASTAQPGRSIGIIGWTFWAIDDNPESAKRLRAAMVETLGRLFTRAGVEEIPEGDSNEAFQARQEAAARLLAMRRSRPRDLDSVLRANAEAAGIELPRSVTTVPSNIYDRTLLTTGAHLLVGGAADLGFEALIEAWVKTAPDASKELEDVRKAYVKAELEGVNPLALAPWAGGLPGMVRHIETSDDRDVCHAVRTCTKAAGILSVLAGRATDDPDILVQLMSDQMWHYWARPYGYVPDGVAGEFLISMSTFQYLAMPDWALELERYVYLMEDLIRASNPEKPTPEEVDPDWGGAWGLAQALTPCVANEPTMEKQQASDANLKHGTGDAGTVDGDDTAAQRRYTHRGPTTTPQ
ncbi:hypothetical protein [Streptomyces sp. NPDC055005]